MTRPNLRLPLLFLMSALAVSACSGGDKDSQASAAKIEAVEPEPSKKAALADTAKAEKAKIEKAKADKAKAAAAKAEKAKAAKAKLEEAKMEKATRDAEKIKKAKKGAANIAGLTLNMDVEEVQRIAETRGFTPQKKPMHKSLSFEQHVESARGGEVDYSKLETIAQLLYEKEASQETLIVKFIPFEEGPLAAEIFYETEATNMTDQLFLERATAKYGDPDRLGRSPVWEFGEGEEKRTVTLKKRTLTLAARHLATDFRKLLKAHIAEEVNKKPAETTF